MDSDTKTLVLTTHRVRFKAAASGRIDFASIMLEEVASCRAAHRSSPLLLALAAIAVIIGVVLQQQNPRDGQAMLIVGVVAAIVCVVLYYGSRRQVLTISAAQGSIDVRMSGSDLQKAEVFVDALEAAKNERLALMSRSAATSAVL